MLCWEKYVDIAIGRLLAIGRFGNKKIVKIRLVQNSTLNYGDKNVQEKCIKVAISDYL